MSTSSAENSIVPLGFVIKDKWKLVKKIGGGGFGEIYEAEDLFSKEKVAAKLESLSNPKQVLKMEVTVLRSLQHRKNVCKFYGCGRDTNSKFNYMIMSLQGRNLADLRRSIGKFSIPTVLKISLQILYSIKCIHQSGFLHRDIKPSNFAIGPTLSTCKTIYMLDFGLARQFIIEKSVRPQRATAGFRGTVRYASLNAHLNKELGRHDDLWSMFYMLVEFVNGSLPWRCIKSKQEVGEMKHQWRPEDLANCLPDEFIPFICHLKSLVYEETPDYGLLRDCIRKAMNRLCVSPNDPFDWEVSTNESRSEKHSKSTSGQQFVTGFTVKPTRRLVPSFEAEVCISRANNRTPMVNDDRIKPLIENLANTHLETKDLSPKPIEKPSRSPSEVGIDNNEPPQSVFNFSNVPTGTETIGRNSVRPWINNGAPSYPVIPTTIRNRSSSAARLSKSSQNSDLHSLLAIAKQNQNLISTPSYPPNQYNNNNEISTNSFTQAVAQNTTTTMSRLLSGSVPRLNRFSSSVGIGSVTQIAGLGSSNWDLNNLDDQGSLWNMAETPGPMSERSDIDERPPQSSSVMSQTGLGSPDQDRSKWPIKNSKNPLKDFLRAKMTQQSTPNSAAPSEQGTTSSAGRLRMKASHNYQQIIDETNPILRRTVSSGLVSNGVNGNSSRLSVGNFLVDNGCGTPLNDTNQGCETSTLGRRNSFSKSPRAESKNSLNLSSGNLADTGLPTRQNSWKMTKGSLLSSSGSRSYVATPSRPNGHQRCSTPKPPGMESNQMPLTDWLEQRHLSSRKSLETTNNDLFVNLMLNSSVNSSRNVPQSKSNVSVSNLSNPVSRLRSGSAVSINRSSVMSLHQQYPQTGTSSNQLITSGQLILSPRTNSMNAVLYNQTNSAKQHSSGGGYPITPNSGKSFYPNPAVGGGSTNSVGGEYDMESSDIDGVDYGTNNMPIRSNVTQNGSNGIEQHNVEELVYLPRPPSEKPSNKILFETRRRRYRPNGKVLLGSALSLNGSLEDGSLLSHDQFFKRATPQTELIETGVPSPQTLGSSGLGSSNERV